MATSEHIRTGISAGNGGEMGDDGHVAPGGEMASMPGGPAQSQPDRTKENAQLTTQTSEQPKEPKE